MVNTIISNRIPVSSANRKCLAGTHAISHHTWTQVNRIPFPNQVNLQSQVNLKSDIGIFFPKGPPHNFNMQPGLQPSRLNHSWTILVFLTTALFSLDFLPIQ